MRATHHAWDSLTECDVPVCDDHADAIRDGRGGRRFDASIPAALSDEHRALGTQCAFSCHEIGCHGYAGRTDADLARAGLS